MMLWADGFDHYGSGATGRANMLDGVWAQLDAATVPQATVVRTGSLALLSRGLERRVFPGPHRTAVGVGYALYLPALPGTSGRNIPWAFLNTDAEPIVVVGINTDGRLTVYQDASSNNGQSAIFTTLEPVIVADAWQHIECFVVLSAQTFALEIRWNGVTVLDESGLDLRAAMFGEQITQLRLNGGIAATNYIDDLIAWDASGSFNNDFIGDRRCSLLLPDGDTAQADWSIVGAGSGFQVIDDLVPDDDSTYVAAVNALGQQSDFDIEDTPPDAEIINAVMSYARARKTDAGDADLQISMVSSGSVDDGIVHPITTEWTYWQDIFEVDPDTGVPWTPAALDAALLRLGRADGGSS